MKQTLNVGIIGLGGICKWSHTPAYQKMEHVHIAAICDSNPEKIRQYRQMFNLPDVPAFTDYHELLQMQGLDFVDICVPNYLHSEIAVCAMEHGLHVFCEKPDAVSVEEAMRMKKASEQYDRQLMVMRNNRHMPGSRYLKKMIESGEMGEIYCGRCGWQRRRGIPGKGGWFTTKAQSGGGPLIDLGVHFIDLAIWLMGNPKPVAVSGCTYQKFANNDVSASVDSAFGETKNDGTFDVEDLAMGFIRFDNGACLQIEFSWASNVEKDHNFVELRGTKAGAKYEDGKTTVYGEEYGTLVTKEPVYDLTDYSGHEQNLRHFADVLLNGAKPDYVPEQGVDMVKILQAIYKSAEIGAEVRL